MTEGKNAYEWMKRLGAHDAGAGAATTKSGCEALTIGTHRSHRVACLASSADEVGKVPASSALGSGGARDADGDGAGAGDVDDGFKVASRGGGVA